MLRTKWGWWGGGGGGVRAAGCRDGVSGERAATTMGEGGETPRCDRGAPPWPASLPPREGEEEEGWGKGRASGKSGNVDRLRWRQGRRRRRLASPRRLLPPETFPMIGVVVGQEGWGGLGVPIALVATAGPARHGMPPPPLPPPRCRLPRMAASSSWQRRTSPAAGGGTLEP